MGQIDLAVRLLAEYYVVDLLPVLLVGRRVEVISVERSEIKLVERVTDQVVLAAIDGRETVLHIEFQTRHEADLPERMLAYHGLLRHRHRPLPVASMLVYLMPDAPAEPVPREIRDEQLDFHYEVFCPWERVIDLDDVRRRPALAPLAVLTPGIDEEDLPSLVPAIEASAEIGPSRQAELMALTYFIGGRRFRYDLLTFLIRSNTMEESSTYQFVMEKGRQEGLEKGRAEGLRRAILDFVAARLQLVPAGLEERLASVQPEALRDIFTRLLRAQDEAELRRLLS